MIQLIYESGEDYLYPSNYFVPIQLPKAVEEAFSLPSYKYNYCSLFINVTHPQTYYPYFLCWSF
jgi:hypothetical protein